MEELENYQRLGVRMGDSSTYFVVRGSEQQRPHNQES